jgi:hypothetical protein
VSRVLGFYFIFCSLCNAAAGGISSGSCLTTLSPPGFIYHIRPYMLHGERAEGVRECVGFFISGDTRTPLSRLECVRDALCINTCADANCQLMSRKMIYRHALHTIFSLFAFHKQCTNLVASHNQFLIFFKFK